MGGLDEPSARLLCEGVNHGCLRQKKLKNSFSLKVNLPRRLCQYLFLVVINRFTGCVVDAASRRVSSRKKAAGRRFYGLHPHGPRRGGEGRGGGDRENDPVHYPGTEDVSLASIAIARAHRARAQIPSLPCDRWRLAHDPVLHAILQSSAPARLIGSRSGRGSIGHGTAPLPRATGRSHPEPARGPETGRINLTQPQ